jgi:tol-pal system protein YbgF
MRGSVYTALCPLRALLAAPIIFGVLGVGCAKPELGPGERQVSTLKAELGRVQADHDKLDERLSALEIHAVAPPASSAPASAGKAVSASVPAMATPHLRVVRLSPEGGGSAPPEEPSPPASEPEDARNDAAPRQVLRLQGTPSAAAPAAERAGESGYRASVLDPRAKKAYDEALALVHAKRYPQALDALAGFLVKWPDHPYAENATYWRGECFFAQGDYERAIEQFEGAMARSSTGNKSPDALLKLALCNKRLGDAARARAYVERLERDFSQSEAARKIPTELR